MTAPIITTDELATYMGIDPSQLDAARAQMLIDDAITQAKAVVWPLPDGAETVIRPAVARVYQNLTGVTQETAGPYTYAQPARTGSILSRRERALLRSLAGGSTAFTIDMLPAGAGQNLPWWDYSYPFIVGPLA